MTSAESTLRVGREHDLWFDPAACLPMRHRGAGCNACFEVCPVRALSPEEYGLTVSRDCTGCGQCMAECPMGALELRSLPSPCRGGPYGVPLEVECGRARGMRDGGFSLVVSCLGALDAAWLIEAHRRAGDGPVLIDDNRCAECPSSVSGDCPVQGELNEARDLLRHMGVASRRLPRRGVNTPVAIPSDAPRCEGGDTISVSRRAFLSRLGRDAGDSLVMALAPVLPSAGRADEGEEATSQRLALPARESKKRERLLEACLSMVDGDQPGQLFHTARIGKQCCNRGICRQVCPSGALTAQMANDRLRVLFDAGACIGCGACVGACPEQAFMLVADGSFDATVDIEIAVHELRRCTGCGGVFTHPRDGDTCGTCVKSRDFAGGLFRQIINNRQTDSHGANSGTGGL